MHRKSVRSLPLLLLAGLALLAVLAVACSDNGEAAPPQEPDEPQRQSVDAPIEDLELLVRESFPPQYAVHVTSGLPGGCARFEGSTVTRNGNTIRVHVTNTEPVGNDIVCTAIYGFHEHTVELGTDFEPGESYRVLVNDRELTFVAQ